MRNKGMIRLKKDFVKERREDGGGGGGVPQRNQEIYERVKGGWMARCSLQKFPPSLPLRLSLSLCRLSIHLGQEKSA